MLCCSGLYATPHVEHENISGHALHEFFTMGKAITPDPANVQLGADLIIPLAEACALIQEATALAAKAEVLQASIGVSCNEEDIQSTTCERSAAAKKNTGSESLAVVCHAGKEGGAQTVGAVKVLSWDNVPVLPSSSVRQTDAADVMLGQQVSAHRYSHGSISKPPLCL